MIPPRWSLESFLRLSQVESFESTQHWALNLNPLHVAEIETEVEVRETAEKMGLQKFSTFSVTLGGVGTVRARGVGESVNEVNDEDDDFDE